MAKYITLKNELDGNTGLYSVMTDQQVVDELNTVKSVVRTAISGSELFGYTDATEYSALTDAGKQQWLGLCGIDSVTAESIPLIKSLFPQGSVTWAVIVKTENTTRARELGLGAVFEEDVRIARAQ